MLRIQSDELALAVDPWMGGGICALTWRGIDIFRPFSVDGTALDLGSFPLVPFCNRIANGNIFYRGKPWTLPPAPAGADPVHALHGIGWRSPWSTIHAGEDLIRLGLNHDGALWPWAFSAQQSFQTSPSGLIYRMSVTNHDTAPMPAGLGLHPYFPKAGAHLELNAYAQWHTGEDRLPTHRRELSQAPRWLAGNEFDHCFATDAAAFTISWPTHRLCVTPSQNLRFAHVYTPQGTDFFCVEPVSHIPNAVHSSLKRAETGLVMLEPEQTMEIECRFEIEEAR